VAGLVYNLGMSTSSPIKLSKFAVYVSIISGIFSLSFLDPINWPKQIALVTLIPWLFWIVFKETSLSIKSVLNLRTTKILIVSIFLFLISALLSFENGTRFLWGSWGRNNGLLTTISLLALAFLASLMASFKDFAFRLLATIEIFVLVSGFYGLIQKFGLDPVQWSSENQIFSFFGNTNFASAIFALGTMTSLILGLFFEQRNKFRYLQIVLASFSAFMTYLTGSLQGLIAIGLASFLMMYVILRQKNIRIGKLFFIVGAIFGAFVLPGFAGIGFLGSVLEQYTIKLRFQYWLIGLEMGSKKLLSGVGVDAYGDSYRENRSLELIRKTTLDLVTNNAHNVFIQYFATLGLLGLVAALLPFLFGAYRAIKVLWNSTNMEDTSIVIIFISLWSMALISIDNIAVAIWNWTFLGAVLGMNHRKVDEIGNFSMTRKKSQSTMLYDPMKLAAGALSILVFLLSWTQSIPDRGILDAKSIYVPEGDQNGPIVQKRKLFQELSRSKNLMENEYFELASEMIKVGDWPQAIDLLNSGVSKYPKNFYLADALAATSENNGLVKEAIPVRINQTKLDPNHAVVWFYLARNYAAVKDYANAKVAFENALKLKEFLSPQLLEATNNYLMDIKSKG
jgi:O-antigen ligase